MQAMNHSLVYLLLRQVLQMLSQLARDGAAQDVELLVLRHQPPYRLFQFPMSGSGGRRGQ
jgi:hypothetical protein